MSEFVLDALPEISEGSKVDIARVYLYAIRRKMGSNITENRNLHVNS